MSSFAVNNPTSTNSASISGGAISGGSAGSSQTSVNSLGSTFLQLLTQELQNQDPTAPVDSTQMVGQMISLNQLDQIASINQLLTSALGGSSSTATPAQSAAAAQSQAGASQSAIAGSHS